jgi:hypothetical protein
MIQLMASASTAMTFRISPVDTVRVGRVRAGWVVGQGQHVAGGGNVIYVQGRLDAGTAGITPAAALVG